MKDDADDDADFRIIMIAPNGGEITFAACMKKESAEGLMLLAQQSGRVWRAEPSPSDSLELQAFRRATASFLAAAESYRAALDRERRS